MNKTELIAAVAEKAELSKKDAEAAITAMVDAITGALSQEEKPQPQDQGGDPHPRLQDPRVQGRQGPEGRRKVIKKHKTGTQRARSRFCILGRGRRIATSGLRPFSQ